MNNIQQIQNVVNRIKWWNISLSLDSIEMLEYDVMISFHAIPDAIIHTSNEYATKDIIEKCHENHLDYKVDRIEFAWRLQIILEHD